MADELWQAFVQIAGGVNALLLGLILIFSPRLHGTRARKKLGLAVLAYGYLLFSFTAVDISWIRPSWWVLMIDFAITLLAAALFYDYMSGSLGKGNVSRYFYLPPFGFLAGAAALGPGFISGPAIDVVVILQIAFTGLTTYAYFSASRQLAQRPRHLLALLVGLWTVHVFQLARLMLPEVGWLFDAVPLVGALLFLIMTGLVLTDSRTLRAISQVASVDHSAISEQAIDAYMQAERPFLDPRLTLTQLAGALGVSSRELSGLMGNTSAGSFYNLINRYRVTEAKRLLADPSEGRTSIEAIGLMSGFRARSTFYEAFRRETGKTPAQYRQYRTEMA